MFVIVSYDIPDDKRRNKIARLLLDYGTRVQYSVFECQLEPKHYQEMRRKLGKLVVDKEDSIRFYQLCRDCLANVEIVGRGGLTQDAELYIV